MDLDLLLPDGLITGIMLVLIRTGALVMASPILGLGSGFSGHKVALVMSLTGLLYFVSGHPVPEVDAVTLHDADGLQPAQHVIAVARIRVGRPRAHSLPHGRVVSVANPPLRTGDLGGVAIQIVGEARSGRDVVPLAEALQPDIILVDISMPHASGTEIIAGLKRNTADSFRETNRTILAR